MLDRELLVQSPPRFRQALGAGTGDRPALLLAPTLQLTPALTKPVAPPETTGHELLRVKLELHPLDDLLARIALGRTLALELLPRGRKRRTTPLPRAQVLRQLIPTRIPETLVLLTIGLLGLLQDLRHDRFIRAISVLRRVRVDLRPVAVES